MLRDRKRVSRSSSDDAKYDEILEYVDDRLEDLSKAIDSENPLAKLRLRKRAGFLSFPCNVLPKLTRFWQRVR